jgi:hypothetical protein
MGSKIDKITKIFYSVEHPKSRGGVTYWTEKNIPLFVKIIDQLQKPVFWPLCLTTKHPDNCWPILFGPISDPLVFNVFYLVKYSSDFIYFISHNIKKRLKNMATLAKSAHTNSPSSNMLLSEPHLIPCCWVVRTSCMAISKVNNS